MMPLLPTVLVPGSPRRRQFLGIGSASLLLGVLLIGVPGCGAAEVTEEKSAPEEKKEPRKKVTPGSRRVRSPKAAVQEAEDKVKKAAKVGDGEKLGGETLASELVKVQSQMNEMQVSLGELKNFQNSVGGRLEELQSSLDSLKDGAESGEQRLASLGETIQESKGLAGKLEKSQGDLRTYVSAVEDRAKISSEKVIDQENRLDEMDENAENLRVDINFLREAGAELEASHEHYLGKDEFSKWKRMFDKWKVKGEAGVAPYYEEVQPRWWHLAVAFLVSLIIGGVVFYLALKAIRPAYSALNEMKAKVTVMGTRQKEEAGEEAPPPQE